jgi:hypothetical protein
MDQGELASVSSWQLLGDWFSEPLQKKLDDARKLEIVQLTTEGQRLAKESETAKASIAAANARALEAQLQLEKLKAPRRINPGKVSAALINFKDQEFSGQVASGIEDGRPLMGSRCVGPPKCRLEIATSYRAIGRRPACWCARHAEHWDRGVLPKVIAAS